MKILKFNNITKKNIENATNIPFDCLVSSYDDSLYNKAIFSKERDKRKTGRGNPLLSRRKIRTIDDINKKLERIN